MTIAREPQVADIPVIDLGILKGENVSPEAIDQIVDQVRSACAKTGFFQIINHSVSAELQQAVFEASKKVFQMPKEEKLALRRDPFGNRGYEVLEGQSLEGAYEGHKKMQAEYSGNDLKEGYYVGKERALDDPMLQRRFNGVNKWPPGIPEFPPLMSKYYDIMYDLAVEIMELIALYCYSQRSLLIFRSLGFEKSYFMDSGFCVEGVAALRLLHYPPQKGGPPRIGAGAHTDFGAVTLLMEDGVGGLQIWNTASSSWQDVRPVQGAYVVNLGDMISKWTRDIYKTTLHRVVNASGKDRYSVPFFFDGALDSVIDCLPGCENGPGGESEPVTVEGHMLRKFAETYGGDDKKS